ncbi:MAG: DUF3891 family protein [Chloroflexales bacterium]|nr:DUF3891 family protein [Chloroflexales bacterium]
MVVNPIESGWEIIYHRAHALLAAQVAARWNDRDSPVHLVETIAALSHHDDLECEWEGSHRSSAGAPLDFTLSEGGPDVASMAKHVNDSRYRGRWVAMLISLHMSFLSEPSRGSDPTLDAFLDAQREQQRMWRKALGVSKQQAAQAYSFMQWCDRMSLILCKHELPSRERALEVSVGPDGRRHDVFQRDDGTLCVEPWPFDRDVFSVSVEACYLDQMAYDSDEALVEALQTAPIKLLEWHFSK